MVFECIISLIHSSLSLDPHKYMPRRGETALEANTTAQSKSHHPALARQRDRINQYIFSGKREKANRHGSAIMKFEEPL